MSSARPRPVEQPLEVPAYKEAVANESRYFLGPLKIPRQLLQMDPLDEIETNQSYSKVGGMTTLKNNFMAPNNPNSEKTETFPKQSKEVQDVSKMLKAPLAVTKEQLQDRQNCFEMFRRSYRKYDAINENMGVLKNLYDKGQQLSNVVKQSRANVERYKNKIEDIRYQIFLPLKKN
jgi:hypothetical protein